ncbi:hypothetical protein CPB86DRAFT_791488, partial [Serendipita vermifera]
VQVSIKWETLVFRTPSLWSSLLIVNYNHGKGYIGTFIYNDRPEYYCETLKSTHVCFEQDHLSKAMSRTGACLLDIKIRFRPYSPLDESLLSYALDILAKPINSKGINSLELHIHPTMLAFMRPSCFHLISLQNLCRIVLTAIPPGWRQNLIQSISTSTRNLEIIRCSPEDLKSLPDPILNETKLITLQGDMTSEQMDNLVSNLTNLREMTPLPMNWPSQRTPQVTLPHLRRASIFCEPPNLRLIRWPSLERLEVHEPGHSMAGNGSQVTPFGETVLNLEAISLPALESLDIQSHRPLYWLSNVITPRLTELRITWDNLPEVMTLIYPIFNRFDSIRSLSLDTAQEDEATISLLSLMPNVVSITIVPTLINESFGLNLLASLIITGNEPPLCPELRHLRLGAAYDRIHTPKSRLEPEIKRVVKMRKKYDFPLCIDVYWSTRDEVQHYSPSKRV